MNINGFNKKIIGDYYVSTLPLPELINLFFPSFMNKSEVCQNIRYRSVRLVNLIINKNRVIDCLEIFSMNKQHIFKRIYEPKAMSGFMAPLGKTSLCLEVCYNKGDEIEKMSKTELVSKCIENLISMKVLKSMDEVKDAFIVEMPNAYPIYNKGFEIDRQKLLDIIGSLDNIITCGRQGLFRYHAMTNEIMKIADRVVGFIEGNCDKRSVNDNNSQWGTFFN
jgi:protoporphyrinogen oxidase